MLVAVSLLSLLVCAWGVADSDYALPGPGPCDVHRYDLPAEKVNKEIGVERARVSVPKCNVTTSSASPLIIFFPAWKADLTYYEAYADNLASWGFAVLQYDATCGSKICLFKPRIKLQVSQVPNVTAWAQSKAEEDDWDAEINWDYAGVSGHSKGGDIAFFSQRDHDFIKASSLIDPLLNRTLHAGTDDDPSHANDKKMAVVSHGIKGPCCPEQEGPAEFFEYAVLGSCEVVVPQSGHAQFQHAKEAYKQNFFNFVCKTGINTDKLTIKIASSVTTAWSLSEMRSQHPLPEDTIDKALSTYNTWMGKNLKYGVVKIKHRSPENPAPTITNVA